MSQKSRIDSDRLVLPKIYIMEVFRCKIWYSRRIFLFENFLEKGTVRGGVTFDPKKFIAKSVLCREAFLESKIKVYGTAGSVQNNWPLNSCANFV